MISQRRGNSISGPKAPHLRVYPVGAPVALPQSSEWCVQVVLLSEPDRELESGIHEGVSELSRLRGKPGSRRRETSRSTRRHGLEVPCVQGIRLASHPFILRDPGGVAQAMGGGSKPM